MPGNFLGTMSDFIGLQNAGEAVANTATGAGEAAAAGAGEAAGLGGLGGAVSAVAGNASAIGPLSVPPTWTPTPAISAAPPPLAGVGGSTAPIVDQGPASLLGGMPLAGPTGRGFGEIPRYGLRPTFVVHPPAAG